MSVTDRLILSLMGLVACAGLTYFSVVFVPENPTVLNLFIDHPNLTAIVAIFLVIYFLPTAIVVMRNRKNAAAIVALNVFLGWTFLGWLGSLIWALVTPKIEVAVVAPSVPDSGQPVPSSKTSASVRESSDLVDRLAKAAQMHAEGKLNDDEFSDLKKRLLASN